MNSTRRALVTGASGYTGSHLCRHLSENGYAVTALVREESDLSRLASVAPGARPLRCGSRAESVADAVALARPDVILHLASLARVVHDPGDLDPMIEANLAFGVRLLEAACSTGAAFVNTGSYSEFDEDGAVAADSLYGATKTAFRSLVDHYRKDRGLRALTLVPFDIYGPGDWRNKFLQQVLAVAAGTTPLMASPGRQELDFVHVRDVVRGYEVAAKRLLEGEPLPQDQGPFSVDGGRRLTLQEFVSLLEAALGKEVPIRWGALPYRPGQRMTLWGGRRLPGWQPHVGLEAGLAECVAAFRAAQ